MIQRRIRPVSTVLVLVLALVGTIGASAQGHGSVATPVAGAEADVGAAAAWLMGQQGDDGGFAGFDGSSDASITTDAVIALVAAGTREVDTQPAIDRAMAWFASGDVAETQAESGQGQAAELVLAATASGGDPRDIGGFDALAVLEDGPTTDSGIYGNGVFDHALVLLALAATGSEVPDAAISVLETVQAPAGGWAFDGSIAEGAADTNTTALVVQALVASGHADSPLIQDATAYLRSAVDGTSGAVYQPGTDFPPDSSSTAMVIQAVIAAGENPALDAWGNLPAALATFQNDDGAFHYNQDDGSSNLFATTQVIPALVGDTLPVQPMTAATAKISALIPEHPVQRAA